MTKSHSTLLVLIAPALLLLGCSGGTTQDLRTHLKDGRSSSGDPGDGGEGIALSKANSVVEREFTFTTYEDSACNQNCLSLVVNGADSYDLGCNKPKPGCNSRRPAVPPRSLKLAVNENVNNVFRLIMTSSDGPSPRPPKVVFDSSNGQLRADLDYHVEARTPSSLDLWINDNDDRDFRDFHGALTGPSDIRFGFENLAHPLYAERRIEECANQGTGPEACLWRYLYKAPCRQNKCSKLVIYFAGGQMTCPDKNPDRYLARYAEAGYVAVCAQIFENERSSGQYPYHTEAGRVDLLVKTITSDPAILQGWNGERLLLSGVSHGATSPVIAMARNDFDATASYWRGSRATGACFFDGIYDARDVLNRSFDKSCQIYPRGYGRYCDFKGDRNDPTTWPSLDTCPNSVTDPDTVTHLNLNNFAIKNWKLIECGSHLQDFCRYDVVPAQSILQLCKRLDADPVKSCAFATFSTVNHDSCGATQDTMDSCRTWFDQL